MKSADSFNSILAARAKSKTLWNESSISFVLNPARPISVIASATCWTEKVTSRPNRRATSHIRLNSSVLLPVIAFSESIWSSNLTQSLIIFLSAIVGIIIEALNRAPIPAIRDAIPLKRAITEVYAFPVLSSASITTKALVSTIEFIVKTAF